MATLWIPGSHAPRGDPLLPTLCVDGGDAERRRLCVPTEDRGNEEGPCGESAARPSHITRYSNFAPARISLTFTGDVAGKWSRSRRELMGTIAFAPDLSTATLWPRTS